MSYNVFGGTLSLTQLQLLNELTVNALKLNVTPLQFG